MCSASLSVITRKAGRTRAFNSACVGSEVQCQASVRVQSSVMTGWEGFSTNTCTRQLTRPEFLNGTRWWGSRLRYRELGD